MIHTLDDDNFDTKVLSSNKLVLVEFTAAWCGPCKLMKTIVNALSEELTNVSVCVVDVDDCHEIATKYKIMSVPTFLLFRDGKVIETVVGSASKTALIALITRNDI